MRLLVVEQLFRHVPPFVANRLRTQALRMTGVRIGDASAFWGLPTLVGSGAFWERLRVGSHCGFNDGCFFELEDNITIGEHVSVGHDVMFLTQSHELGQSTRRAGTPRHAPIVIEDGAWLGARATVLPGITIGAGAVIGASVVVSKDVPPNTLVMGAQQISLAKWR